MEKLTSGETRCLYNASRTHRERQRAGDGLPRNRTRGLPSALAVFCILLCGLFLAPAGAREICPVLAPYSADVEAAVERGLRYIMEQQREDGSFPGQYGRSAGVVSLAGMSFMAAGHTPGRDAYGETINRCLDYVLAQQRDSGYIEARDGSDRGMYTHHMSTLFLAEVSGMVDPQREERVREAISRAVGVIVKAQNVSKSEQHTGGWRYSPTARDSDLSVSGWGVMALRSARLNGARVPDENIQRAIEYVLRMQHENGGFGYQNPGQNRPTLTGLGVLCLALTGYHDSEPFLRGARYLEERFTKMPQQKWALYGVYYCAQAAFQAGGSTWEKIGPWLYETYLPRQKQDGSWGSDAAGGSERGYSDVYNTAMLLLSLSVPYRQLPIYQRDETVDE